MSARSPATPSLLHDVSEERVKAGLATIDGNLARQVASGRIAEADRKRAIGKIQPALSLDQFSDVDLASSPSARTSR